jgi:plasmid stability protein
MSLPGSPSVEVLSTSGFSPGWPLGSVTALAVAATAAVIIYAFMNTQASSQGAPGITRSMLAIVLIGGLMILAGASFTAGVDAQTRNLLLGGVVASSSAAVAFYFASRSAETARRDVLNAAFGTEIVPKLEDLTVSAAQAVTSRGSLALGLSEPPPADTDKIKTQSPAAGASVARGTTISVTTAP